jgi:hypothetical protein
VIGNSYTVLSKYLINLPSSKRHGKKFEFHNSNASQVVSSAVTKEKEYLDHL